MGAIDHVCERCGYIGHTEAVHDVKDFKQRRAIVDTLGWEPFQDWFYDQTFRGWWQVTGCVGVPLYRIYPRKTAWRTEARGDRRRARGKVVLHKSRQCRRHDRTGEASEPTPAGGEER